VDERGGEIIAVRRRVTDPPAVGVCVRLAREDHQWDFLEKNGASDDWMAALKTPTFECISKSANKKSKRAVPTRSETSNQVRHKLSTSTMGDIEKHYHSGIGMRSGPTLEFVKKAEIDSWVFEVPITSKYRYPFTMKTNGLASVGYSSFIFREQAFAYSYDYDGNNDIARIRTN
jgi:hypothetical protein